MNLVATQTSRSNCRRASETRSSPIPKNREKARLYCADAAERSPRQSRAEAMRGGCLEEIGRPGATQRRGRGGIGGLARRDVRGVHEASVVAAAGPACRTGHLLAPRNRSSNPRRPATRRGRWRTREGRRLGGRGELPRSRRERLTGATWRLGSCSGSPGWTDAAPRSNSPDARAAWCAVGVDPSRPIVKNRRS